ncbi:MAG: 3-keto-disaccharide hydrolase [Planctomycetota bacterium]
MTNRTFQTRLLATLMLAWVCMAGCAANEKKPVETDEEGFVSIFDGKTLKGWRALPAETAPAWTVTGGMIVGDGDKGRGYLTFENHEIADLEIKLSYRFPDKGNSGISIRAREDKTGKRHFQAYHADFGHVGIGKQVLGAWDFHTPGRKEHACFRGDRLVIDENDKPLVTKIEGAVTKEDINKGDWNTVHVIARGNNFKFFINGKLSSEFTEHLPSEKRLHRGMIQLQLHDPGMIVHFKDIRLKILK